MGNCFGRCLATGRNGLRHSTDEQEADELVQEDETKKDNFIFKIIKFKKKKNRPQFIEKFWEQNDTNYKRLNPQENPFASSEIQLQCLDANTLLKSTNSSDETNALDLPLTTMKFNQNFPYNRNQYQYHQHQQNNIYHHGNCYKSQNINSDTNNLNTNCCGSNTTNNYYTNNINSSRASSSLDLEWEHEYGNNIDKQNIIIDTDEIKNLTQSWYFIPSDDEFLSKSKKYNISDQHLFSICDEDDDDDDDDDDDYENNKNNINQHEYGIDVVNCQNKNLIKCNNTTNLLLVENHNNYYMKNLNKSIITATTSEISTPSSIEPSNSYNIVEEQQQQLQYQKYNYKHNQQQIPLQQQYQQQQLQQQPTIYTRTPSRTSWSHISTPESLEWDIDEEQQKQLRVEDDNLDHETLELLHEIELLKNKVLNETGSGLIDEKFEMNWKDNSS